MPAHGSGLAGPRTGSGGHPEHRHGDADRSLTLTGNASISGTNTGDQTVPVIVSQVNASASATLDFALTSGYRCYHLELDNIKPATDDVALYFRVGTGGTPTYQTSGYYWGSTNTRGNVTFAQGSTSAGQIQTGPDTGGSAGVGNATGESISGWIEFSRPDATDFMQVSWHVRYVRADGTPAMSTGSGHWATAGVVTACRIFMSSGNISSGKVTLIGKP